MQAMAAKLMFDYNAAGEPPYKSVLDAWLCRTPEGRGAVFSTIETKELLRPLGQRALRLRFPMAAILLLPWLKTTAPQRTHPHPPALRVRILLAARLSLRQVATSSTWQTPCKSPCY